MIFKIRDKETGELLGEEDFKIHGNAHTFIIPMVGLGGFREVIFKKEPYGNGANIEECLSVGGSDWEWFKNNKESNE